MVSIAQQLHLIQTIEHPLIGIYCVIFSLYLGIQFKRANPWKGVLLYALTLNFILCTAYCVVNVVQLQFSIGVSQIQEYCSYIYGSK